MSKIDTTNIGQKRTVQDPMDAIRSAEGTYKDVVPEMPPEQRYPAMPQVASPDTMGQVTKRGSGTR